MRGVPGSGEDPSAAAGAGRKRLDLSLPQVAGSAVAAVVAAKLASYFGVYGTILGAGLVSIVATCGGTVFQHFFKRTGEQIRDVGVQGRPVRPGVRPAPAAVPVPGEFTSAGPAEFGEGTVYRARVRSWKRPLVAAALVFGVTMAGVTTYEMASGQSFSGDGKSTTVGDAFTGSGSGNGPSGRGRDSAPESGTPGTTPPTGSSRQPSNPGSGDGSGATGGEGGVTTPTPTPSSSADPVTPDGTPTPSASTSPAPDAGSHSRSADPDPADPATP
ncbi:hypothetical protein [Streptomyces sp. NPDC006333]|uniref:hypothetical protein n=1 Tax=Streptomyces sp. NPDC006333 TaxID=3156753 RepID=UPI0033A53270|nr:hypothetical protein OG199_12755 [Streptomyces sp. NBC_01176]